MKYLDECSQVDPMALIEQPEGDDVGVVGLRFEDEGGEELGSKWLVRRAMSRYFPKGSGEAEAGPQPEDTSGVAVTRTRERRDGTSGSAC